jgi:hypothetical protein
MEHNWTWIREHLVQWSFQGYELALGGFFWVILFMSIIGYIYLKQRSYTAAAVAILILVSVFSNVLMGVPVIMIFLYIVVALAMTVLFLMLFIKWRGG